ncbi:MAG: PadR family transcriptional regulator [Planctomycetota bacterium]
MTVRQSLLALLADRPRHGYGLKSGFEDRTGGAWPLNVGQVYTTLARLQRDGLVATDAEDDGDRQVWRITPTGREALEEWYARPVVDDPPARDELAIKVLLAMAAESVEIGALLQSQRRASMERLQELTRLKARADPEHELPWLLLLDALVLKMRAEIEWLDLCEQRLAARQDEGPGAAR